MNASITAFQYGRSVVADTSFERAVELAKAALKDEGFGVLCEIDVTATMKEKLGEVFRPYRILGACNPALAHKALSQESQLGLLLPCNLVVQEEDGKCVVSAIDAHAMLGIVGRDGLAEVADDVNNRFARVLERIAKAS